MNDTETPSGEHAGAGEPHPVDAVLAALRAVPDSVLRNLEPATIYVPEPTRVGGTAAATGDGTSGGPK